MVLLQGKKALITGGTSGIGREIAVEFARQGAQVHIFGTSKERAEAAIAEIESVLTHPNTLPSFDLVNVGNYEEVHSTIEKYIQTRGAPDILVNCAGITRDKLLLRMTEQDWDDVIDINLKSVYNMCHALLKGMLKNKGGKIINIGSVIGLMGNPGQINYAASKMGMIGFTRSLAKEIASRNIQVNCIAPGYIQTSMTEALNDKQREEIAIQIPLGRLGTPKDVALAAVFLASPWSDYITGQVIPVDGGMLA